MDTSLLVKLPNRPGAVASAAGAIGRANVNIRAVAAASGAGAVRFLTDDADAAHAALTKEGFSVERRPVVALPISDTPGELALVCERLARAGINLEAVYMAVAGQRVEVVVEVASPKEAAAAARGELVARLA
jgi:hypothetical protein